MTARDDYAGVPGPTGEEWPPAPDHADARAEAYEEWAAQAEPEERAQVMRKRGWRPTRAHPDTCETPCPDCMEATA